MKPLVNHYTFSTVQLVKRFRLTVRGDRPYVRKHLFLEEWWAKDDAGRRFEIKSILNFFLSIVLVDSIGCCRLGSPEQFQIQLDTKSDLANKYTYSRHHCLPCADCTTPLGSHMKRTASGRPLLRPLKLFIPLSKFSNVFLTSPTRWSCA